MNLPLTVYDILGYLASGFLVLAAVELGFDGNWLIDRDWKPGSIALYVTIAYVLGHILANLSSHLIETKFGREWLGASEDLMFRDAPATGTKKTWREWFFPGFYKPLPKETQTRVLAAAAGAGLTKPGRALFFHALAVVKSDKNTLDRLNTFLNLYGFCRNMAFALLVAVAVIGASGLWYALYLKQTDPDARKIAVAVLCVFGSVGMLYRYLKFYRHYTQEVFITYPEIKKP